MLKAQNKKHKVWGIESPLPLRPPRPAKHFLGLAAASSELNRFFFPGLALPRGGAADGRRERPPAKRFLILHFNRFQKAPWRNANRLKCQNREGVSSRSADLILFSALIFFFLVGRKGVGSGVGGGKGWRAPTQEALGRGARCKAPQLPPGPSGGRAPARVSIGTPFRRLETHPLPAAEASPKY